MSRLVVEQIALSPADYDVMVQRCREEGRFPGPENLRGGPNTVHLAGVPPADWKLEFWTSHGVVEIMKAQWVREPVVTVCAPPKR